MGGRYESTFVGPGPVAIGQGPEAGPDWQKALVLAGVGVVGGGALLGSLLWVVRNRDALHIKVTHEVDPVFVSKYGPLLEKGVDVNLRLFPGLKGGSSKGEGGGDGDGGGGGRSGGRGRGTVTRTGLAGYDANQRSPWSSPMPHLLDALGADMSDAFGADNMAETLISEGIDDDDDFDLLSTHDLDLLGDDVGGEDEDEDWELLPGVVRLPGMTVWDANDGRVREQVGVAGVHGVSFGEADGIGKVSSFQSPLEISVDDAIGPNVLPKHREHHVLRAIPYMSTKHLQRIVHHPRRSKRVYAAARAELARRLAGHRPHHVEPHTFPPAHAGWQPGAHWAGHAWPEWHPRHPRRAAHQAARPQPAPPQRAVPPAMQRGGGARPGGPGGGARPGGPGGGARPGGPGGGGMRPGGPGRRADASEAPDLATAPAPGVLRQPPLQARLDRQIGPRRHGVPNAPRLGADPEPPSLIEAWGAHPFQTALAGLGAMALGAAAVIGVERMWSGT